MDLQTNVVTITPASDVELDLAAIPDAIHGAGFTPEHLRIAARGELVERAGAAAFRIRGWRTEIPVRGDAAHAQGEVDVAGEVVVSGGALALVLDR